MAVETTRERLSLLFEGAPAFVARLLDAGPFASEDELFDRARRIALELPRDEQIELLNGHPRIGAAAAELSALSYREQDYGRDPGSPVLQARLDRLNDEYEQRHGFRCVIFVAGRSRAEIAAIIERQLGAPTEAELRRGLADVIAIARDRTRRLEEDG